MNNEKCEFCKGTGIEPGQADCKWCVNTGTKEGQKNALTESSNAEKMVSVRERLYEIANRDSAVSVTVRADDLRAFLAEQHQCEPVAMPCRMDHNMHLAHQRSLDWCNGWNACLDEVGKLGPLYTHPAPADAGEVERLRQLNRDAVAELEDRKQEIYALRAQLAERDALPQFAKTVIRKLKRFRDCAEDGQGADIGKTWLDVLVQLGLLNRVQRSPAWWEITDEGDALLDGRAALSASAEPEAKS